MTNNILKKNIKLFNDNYLSTNDVLLKPTRGVVSSRSDIAIEETFIYSSPMDTVTGISLIKEMDKYNQASVSCRFKSNQHRLLELERFISNKNYWFSVGASVSDFDMLKIWASKFKVTPKINISVDVAHGNTDNLNQLYKNYSKQRWCKKLMSGTVATGQAALDLVESGCTHIRVGIGPGSACSTRVVTGCGVPNLSAIHDVWLSLYDAQLVDKTTIIADGGIKTTGDIVKYLSAGADAVMLGNLLSKTYESSGWKTNLLKFFLNKITFKKFFNDFLYKNYRGQASAAFQLEKKGKVSGTPEGVQGPKQSPQYYYSDFHYKVISALRSAISYLGGKNIVDLNPRTVEMIQITQSSYNESIPHLLN
jgi:IMP dehydrogenase